MLSKAIAGSILLLLVGFCFAGTAEEMAEEQALAYGKHLPMAFGESLKLVAARSHGSKIILDVKIDAARGGLSKSKLKSFLQAYQDIQCADPTNRNFMAQGVSIEMNFIWKDNVTSSVAVTSGICGIKKGEVNAESGDSLKNIVDDVSPTLPMKVDENTTWVSISQVGRLGLKYTYVLDDSKHKFDTSQLNNMKLQVERTVCMNKSFGLMMRGGVEYILLYKSISGKPLFRTTITSASCKG